MSKANIGLTDEKCASLSFSNNGKNKLFDGAGLYLEVTSNGSKRWRMRYKQKNGKETLITFGEYPAITLEQARKARENVRNAVAKGEDPTKARDAALGSSASASTSSASTASAISAKPADKTPAASKATASSTVVDKKKEDDIQIPASLSKNSSTAKAPVASSVAPATTTTNVRSSTLVTPPSSSTSLSAPSKEQKIVARVETTEPAVAANKEMRSASVPVSNSTVTAGKNESVPSDTGSVQVESIKTIQGSAIPKTANSTTKSITPASSNVTHINPVGKNTVTAPPAQVTEQPSATKKIMYRSVLIALLVAGGVFLFEEYRLHQRTTALQEAEKQLVVADGVMQQSAMLNSEIKKLESESTIIKKENQDLLSINQRLEASQNELIEARDIAVRLKDEVQAALDKALVLNSSLQAQLKEIRGQLARAQQMYQSERQTREKVQQNLDTEQQNAAQINSLRNEYLRNRGQ